MASKTVTRSILDSGLRKDPTFRHATTGFAAKWRLRNERRNSILMTPYYPDIGTSTALFGYWHVISMEFLRSFPRRHFFAGKAEWWRWRKSAASSLPVMLHFFSAVSLLIQKLCRKLLPYPQTRVVSQNGPRIHSQRTLMFPPKNWNLSNSTKWKLHDH